MKIPTWSPGKVPHQTQSFAEASITSERGSDGFVPCSGPPSSTRYCPPKIAIQFSMIVVITSWAPTSRAGTRRSLPTPCRRGSRRRCPSTTYSGRGRPCRCVPTKSAAMKPTQYWPWPPMLKRPAPEGERDRERGQDQRRRHAQRLLEVLGGDRALVAGHPGEEPVEAGPVEDRPVGGDRVVAGDQDDEAADQEGENGRCERHERSADPLVEDAVKRGSPVSRRVARGSALAHAASFCAAAGHRDAELLVRDVRPVLADDAALVDDEDPVGERQDLVQLERDEEDRPALVPLRDEPLVHELDRADVEPARGLSRDEGARVARDLPRDHDLLLVSARERRQRASAGRRRGRRTPSAASSPASVSRRGKSQPNFESGAFR